MARITVLKCDMCGRNYELGNQYKHVDGEAHEFVVNSIRLGDWDQKNKRWNSIASGYDLCSECARKICDVVFSGDSQIKMRAVNQKKKEEKVESSVEETDDGK